MSSLPSGIKKDVMSAMRQAFIGDVVARETREKYRHDWAGFMEDILKITVTDSMREIIDFIYGNPISLIRSANGIGKSFTASALAITFLFTQKESKVRVISYPSTNTRIVMSHAREFALRPDLAHLFGGWMVNKGSVVVSPKSELEAITIPLSADSDQVKASMSGVHSSGGILVIGDEADTFHNKPVSASVFEAMESWMGSTTLDADDLDAPRNHQCFFFNPKASSGYLDQLMEEGAPVLDLDAFSHVNVKTRSRVIPGAIEYEKTVSRVLKMTRPIDDIEIASEDIHTDQWFVVPDHFVSEHVPAGKRLILPQHSEFATLVLGRKPPMGTGSGAIDPEMLEYSTQRHSEYVLPEKSAFFAGIDPSDSGTDWTIMCLRYGAWTEFHKVRNRSMASDMEQLAGILGKKLHDGHLMSRCVIDRSGVGAGSMKILGDALKHMGHGVQRIGWHEGKENAKGFSDGVLLKRQRDQVLWRTKEFIMVEHGMVPHIPHLLEDLKMLSFQNDGRHVVFITKKEMVRQLRRSTDHLDALSLTFAVGSTSFSTI